ncbi:hypothetical protein HHX47_DHR1002011 [Lentinula edodes]|nr:hypothetical protein HHX47_DHR1002011 [Lentinula edodes]
MSNIEDCNSSRECLSLRREELEVLESIYPDYISNDISKGSIKLEIPVELGDLNQVLVKDAAHIGHPTSNVITLTLSLLPPLLVHIVLPETYPLQAPPKILSIRASHAWILDTSRLRDLIVEMWDMRAGEGVLCDMVEFIRSGAFLKELGMVEDHFWGLCITEGDVLRVGCPDPQCVKEGRQANEEEVARAVSEEAVARWRWLKEKSMIEKGILIVGVIIMHGPVAACPISAYETLVLDYLALPEESPGRKTIENRFGRSIVAKMVVAYQEEQAFKQWLANSSTPCPGCNVHIEKSLGCNHVRDQMHKRSSYDRLSIIDGVLQMQAAFLLSLWVEIIRHFTLSTFFHPGFQMF